MRYIVDREAPPDIIGIHRGAAAYARDVPCNRADVDALVRLGL